MKDNRTKTQKWFDGEIADELSAVHFLSFNPKLWQAMDKSRRDKSVVALKNCSIQKSRRTLNFEIIANKTKVDSSPRKFDNVDRHTSIKTLCITEACKLSTGSIVSLMVKVSHVQPPEKLLRSDKQLHVVKQDCTIGDATGSCRLVLWANRVGALTEGHSYNLKSVVVRQYNNVKYMSVLEHTTDFESITDIGEVDDKAVAAEKKHCRRNLQRFVPRALSWVPGVQVEGGAN